MSDNIRCLATSSSSSAASNEHKRFPHDAPERDFVNFPAPSVPAEAGKVRIGLVPDDWFKAMYDKTGVTGNNNKKLISANRL